MSSSPTEPGSRISVLSQVEPGTCSRRLQLRSRQVLQIVFVFSPLSHLCLVSGLARGEAGKNRGKPKKLAVGEDLRGGNCLGDKSPGWHPAQCSTWTCPLTTSSPYCLRTSKSPAGLGLCQHAVLLCGRKWRLQGVEVPCGALP